MAPKRTKMLWGQEEGVTISLGEEAWGQLSPCPNVIVEVNLQGSSASYGDEEVWAAILVRSAERADDGGWLIAGDFLGAEEGLTGETGSDQFGLGGLHLCVTDPCGIAERDGLHVNSIRLWSPLTFKCDYLHYAGEGILQKLKDEMKKPPPKRAAQPRGGAKKEAKPKVTPAAAGLRLRKGKKADVIDISEEEDERDALGIGEGGEKDIGVDRQGLRKRLQATRERILGGAPRQRREEEDWSGGPEPKDSRPVAPWKRLVTGTSLEPRRATMLGLSDQPASRRGGMKNLVERLEKRQDCNSLLLAQAVQSAAESKKRKKKDKKRSSAEILVSLLKGKDGSKKKKKKRKKREKMKPDPDDPGDSSSEDEEESSTTEAEDQEAGEASDSSCEPPLKRKAQKRPGSVMEMLVRHAQEQVNKGNLVETEEGGSVVTQGVKISTYFALLIRPFHQAGSPLLRELYSLAQTIDYLRAGRLPEAADALAARFVACHTALAEGHWGTAAQLELHPLEPTASTSTATMLQAQKHRRLLWKSQGYYPPRGWSGQGKGKGNPSEKGKKGGGKEKGKGKGKGGNKGADWNQGAKGGANPWKDNKEETPKA